MFRIYELSTHKIVFQEISTGNGINVPASVLEPNKDYKIHQYLTKEEHFNIHPAVSSLSKIVLGYIYSAQFKTTL